VAHIVDMGQRSDALSEVRQPAHADASACQVPYFRAIACSFATCSMLSVVSALSFLATICSSAPDAAASLAAHASRRWESASRFRNDANWCI
jgi:hypothetical protein